MSKYLCDIANPESCNVNGIRMVVDGIYKVTANIMPDANTLFEGMWPMYNGVSINGYIIKGEKMALVDLTIADKFIFEDYCMALKELGITFNDIDYVVVNHMEPDHTGSMAAAFEMNPNMQIVCTSKALQLFESFYGISKDSIKTVSTGDRLDLGAGKSLLFTETPNVHWPETMMTFEEQTGTLFSCDVFGGFGLVPSERIFDDEQNEEQMIMFKEELDRYYSNVVITFSNFIAKAISLVEHLPIKIVAPSHGLVWRKDVNFVMDRYRELSSYAQTGGVGDEICIIWGSMYGNTEKAVVAMQKVLENDGIKCHSLRVPQTHVSVVLPIAFKCKGIVLAMPTYEYKIFPPVMNILNYLHHKKIFHKCVFKIGSYGWIGGSDKELFEISNLMDYDVVPVVEWAGSASVGDMERIEQGLRNFIKCLKAKGEEGQCLLP